MDEGTYFKPVITDDGVPAKKVKKASFLPNLLCHFLLF